MAQGPRAGNYNRGARQVAPRTQEQPSGQIVKARAGKKSILDHMAARLNMDAMDLQRTLLATVFQGASNEEFAALLVVSEAYKLNPLTKEIYAFPKKGGGIMPLVSIDGWIRIINEHPQMAGIEWEDIPGEDGNLLAIATTIYRRDRERPVTVIEYLSECKQNTDPWNKMPARMLRHKSSIQCARYAFGFSGIYDSSDVDMVDARAFEAETVPPMRRIEDPGKAARNVTPEPTKIVQPTDGEATGETAIDNTGHLYDTGSGEVQDEPVDGEPTPPTHPAWNSAGDIADDLSDVANMIDLNSFRARTLADIEAMPQDVQDVINTKLDEHEAKLKGGK